ncbi:hypothetical protein MFFC18_47270 [Mariniblastus fucicola]|uniref:Uncharacterized protein n=1 Tax=Mariniblastus fucicola TaxID=980251 RepID=A0A5B9PEW8_9BACT|nr:hypothetical protein MFFC18_47270 [Mariniblastus fucicola]
MNAPYAATRNCIFHLILFVFLTGCHPASEVPPIASGSHPISSLLKADVDAKNRVKQVTKNTFEESGLTPFIESIGVYLKELEKLDASKCPADFQEAFQDLLDC